ncbi:MAG: 2-C-methyl-D-erythritol 4-phosphate cytidylyltransferase [Candidatus Margulisiibacteriota bacterium]
MKKKIITIIAAGGSGKRMGKPKQMLEICGVPVLKRTIDVFKGISSIEKIIVATAKENFDVVRSFDVEVVEAGAERQNSVANALATLPDDTDMVIVHDGARPLITKDIIEKAIDEAEKYGAAVVAVKVKDTVKKVKLDGFIDKTIDRDSLWQAQTPQVFKFKLLTRAYENSKQDVTDDSSLVEALGQKVRIVEGSYENIKITTPEDLVIASNILENRL